MPSGEAVDVIEDMLRNSLRNLGIEIARFSSLPHEQRKLALADTLINLASELSSDFDWVIDRARLSTRNIEDFDIAEIETHRAILDCLISLVCIGESSFLTSLVAYLQFPDVRWTIGVDALLNSLVYEKTSQTFGIPNTTKCRHWAAWCITSHAGQHYQDLTSRVFKKVWGESRSTSSSKINHMESDETGWQIALSSQSEHQKKRYDSREIAFCNTTLLKDIFHRDAHSVCLDLEKFVSKSDSTRDFETTSAFLIDNLNDAAFARTIVDHAENLIDSQKLSPETTGILARGLIASGLNVVNRLASSWLASSSSKVLFSLVKDVLTSRMTAKSIRTLTYLVARSDSLGSHNEKVLKFFMPKLENLSYRWICRSLFNEMDKICCLVTLQNIGPSEMYYKLWKRFVRHAQEVDRTAIKILNIRPSLRINESCAKKIRIVLEYRSRLAFHEKNESTPAIEIAEIYQKLLDEIKSLNSKSDTDKRSLDRE